MKFDIIFFKKTLRQQTLDLVRHYQKFDFEHFFLNHQH